MRTEEEIARPAVAAAGEVASPPRRLNLVRRVATLVVLALPLVIIPLNPLQPQFVWSASNSALGLATSAAVFAILAYGIGLLLRFTGLASMGHGALFGVGAYASAIGLEQLGLGFSTALLLAVIVTALVATAVGALALRMDGMAFLIITIAFGELLVLAMLNWESLTNGPLGMYVTENPSLLGMTINTPVRRYLVALFFLYLVVAVIWLLGRSLLGRRLGAIRDNEPLARSLGFNAFMYKLAAFVLSASIAGLGGHLYFLHLRAVTPDLFGVIATITVFLMVVMGGTRALIGPAVGAWVVVFLPVWFEPLGLDDPHNQEIAFGVLLMIFMLAAPAGIVGGISTVYERVARRFAGQPSRVEAAAVVERGESLGPVAGGAPADASTKVAPTDEVLLEIHDVKRHYGAVRAVDGVSFAVNRGEIVGIIGPNGSGKTTLVNCISGFQSLTAGSIRWKGEDISSKQPHQRARAGLLRTFQQSMSFGEYTPRQHCELVWKLGERSTSDLAAHITSTDDVLRMFHLDHVADVPAADLPYGNVSNLGIAVAVATKLPELLVLDEPAAGLTTAEGLALQQRLRLLRDQGVTILIIDHDMPFLMPMCDRVVVLDAGQMIMDDSPEAVQRDTRVIAAYLGERFAENHAREMEGEQ